MAAGSLQTMTVDLDPVRPEASTPDRVRSTIAFGRFVALPAARTLLCAGRPVELGARAFDLLIVLLASRGEVVSKEAIITYVWPTTTVDESNLRFQMAVLRKALGDERDIIKTVPGRGYLLAGEIEGDARSIEPIPSPFRSTPSEDADCQRIVRDALCALLRAIGRHPAALGRLEEMLSAELPRSPVGGADAFALA